jgi:hypothetical protein
MQRALRLGLGALAPIAFLSPSSISSTAPIAIPTSAGGGADSYVADDSQQSINTTHGGENTMAIRRFDGTRQKLMYLRFDISSLGTDPRVDAFLTWNLESTANRDRAFDVYGIIDGPNDNWNEATLTYNDLVGLLAPTTINVGEAPVFDFTDLTLLGRVGMIGAGPQILSTNNATDLDTNGAILNLINADTNGLVSFIVVMSASDSTASYFATSKEGNAANPTRMAPTLTIIPEPASLGLLGSMTAAAAMLATRRRSARGSE